MSISNLLSPSEVQSLSPWILHPALRSYVLQGLRSSCARGPPQCFIRAERVLSGRRWLSAPRSSSLEEPPARRAHVRPPMFQLLSQPPPVGWLKRTDPSTSAVRTRRFPKKDRVGCPSVDDLPLGKVLSRGVSPVLENRKLSPHPAPSQAVRVGGRRWLSPSRSSSPEVPPARHAYVRPPTFSSHRVDHHGHTHPPRLVHPPIAHESHH